MAETEFLGINLGFTLFEGFGNTMVWVFVLFLMVIVMGVIIWLVYQWRIYNIRVIDWEFNQSGGWRRRKDKARLLKVGDGGEEIMLLKRKKQLRGAYGRKMAPNEYWFARGQDGYFYNIVLGDIDAKMGMLDIEPIDRDMRYMHVAVRKNAADRYTKQSFLDKYGTFIAGALILIILLAGTWFNLDKQAENIAAGSQVQQSTNELVQAQERILTSLDNILNGGQGLQAVNQENG